MTQAPSPTAVILAAGASRRMGAPKALLPWGGATILGQTLRNVRRSRVSDILVVTGDPGDGVADLVRAYAIRAVPNPTWASDGLTGSLQAAIRAMAQRPTAEGAAEIDGVPAPTAAPSALLVLLADQPLIGPDVIDVVVAAHVDGGHDLIAAASGGRRGHPVLFGRAYFDALLALPPGGAPRDLLDRHAGRLHLVDVATDAIFIDIDTPEAYARWRPEETGE